MSKLYTEEQLKEFFKEHYFITEEDLKNFIPIQLPTDEDIYINSNVNSENTEQHIGFIKGIQLMRELIKNNK